VLALELRLVPNFDIVAVIRTRNDEEWIVDATFALQLFSGQVLAATASPFRLDGGREDRFEAGRLLASTHHHPLIHRTLGDIVALSLGGGQGNGTTDPSAHSDLKGREVGTRSAELHDILSPSCGDKPEIQRQSLGHPRFPKDSMAGSISKIGGCSYVLVLD
jgi:hypothetical protein